jgi:hypothetical protein
MAINLGKDGDIISSGDTLAYITNWELNMSQDALETSAFGGGFDRTYVPGLRTATATASGYFADDDTGARNLFLNMMSTRTPALVAFKLKYGTGANAGYEGNGVITGVTVGVPNDGLQTFSANIQFTGGVSTI